MYNAVTADDISCNSSEKVRDTIYSKYEHSVQNMKRLVIINILQTDVGRPHCMAIVSILKTRFINIDDGMVDLCIYIQTF